MFINQGLELKREVITGPKNLSILKEKLWEQRCPLRNRVQGKKGLGPYLGKGPQAELEKEDKPVTMAGSNQRNRDRGMRLTEAGRKASWKRQFKMEVDSNGQRALAPKRPSCVAFKGPG